MFSEIVRHWRHLRNISQEQLGERIGQSQRHISFIENARTRPSSMTIRRIVQALDISARDGNRMLNLAGYADALEEPDAESRVMSPELNDFASLLIRGIRPYPASIADRRRRNVRMNISQALWWSRLAHLPEIFDDDYISFPRALFHPLGMRVFMQNWEDLAGGYIQVIHRMRINDPEVGEQLYSDILALTDLPDSWKTLNDEAPDGTTGLSVHAFTLKGPVRLRFMTFEVRTPDDQPNGKFPSFFVNVNVPEDKESEQRLALIWEDAKIENVHERIRPALVPFEESPSEGLSIVGAAMRQMSA